MHYDGILIGLCSFFIIGFFHPVVIKAEYHLSKRVWPIFLLAGGLLLLASLFTRQHAACAILGVAGFSCLWSIRELHEQEARVRRGWFPQNPKRDKPSAPAASEPPRHFEKEEPPMEMRRKTLAVTEPEQIDAIINSCDCFRLAFADGTHPYILPLSFGYERRDGAQYFYYHGAAVGRKIDLSRKLAYAGFELDTNRKVNPDEKACDFSVRYQSVIGEGSIRELTEPKDKAAALQVLMKKFSGRGDWELPETVLAKTCVFCLTVTEISAKAHG